MHRGRGSPRRVMRRDVRRRREERVGARGRRRRRRAVTGRERRLVTVKVRVARSQVPSVHLRQRAVLQLEQRAVVHRWLRMRMMGMLRMMRMRVMRLRMMRLLRQKSHSAIGGLRFPRGALRRALLLPLAALLLDRGASVVDGRVARGAFRRGNLQSGSRVVSGRRQIDPRPGEWRFGPRLAGFLDVETVHGGGDVLMRPTPAPTPAPALHAVPAPPAPSPPRFLPDPLRRLLLLPGPRSLGPLGNGRRRTLLGRRRLDCPACMALAHLLPPVVAVHSARLGPLVRLQLGESPSVCARG